MAHGDWCEGTKVSKGVQPSLNIETKAFHGWRGNLPSSQEGNVRHQRPDSLVKITEDSNGANTGETSEAEADREKVEEEHIPIVPIKIWVPLALYKLKDFNVPVKLKSGVLQSRNHRKWSLFVSDAESSIAAVGDNC